LWIRTLFKQSLLTIRTNFCYNFEEGETFRCKNRHAMKKLPVFLWIIGLMVASCSKKDEPVPVSGTVTLDSRMYFNSETQNYYMYGFDFDLANKVKYERMVSGAGTDLVLSALPGVGEGPEGGYFTSPHNEEAFYLAGSFGSSEDAGDFYHSLQSFALPVFDEWANPVLPDQVWIIQTKEMTYAKLWIRSVEVAGPSGDEYVECSFEWTYQPDGSMFFPE